MQRIRFRSAWWRGVQRHEGFHCVQHLEGHVSQVEGVRIVIRRTHEECDGVEDITEDELESEVTKAKALANPGQETVDGGNQ